MTNPFSKHVNTKSWEWPVSLVSLLLGVMISLAWINQKTQAERSEQLPPDIRRRYIEGRIDLNELTKLSEEVSRLREENTKLQNAMADNSKQSKVLNESLQEVKMFSGLTDVEGPGLTITLRDSEDESSGMPEDRIIHDGDVLRTVNELWASGAEAIEVNGHRIVMNTSFRCVGPVIHVEGVPIASPVMVRVIGDTKTLEGAMKLPGGVLDELRTQDPNMVQIDRVTKHRFKAYAGNTVRKFIKLPEAKK
ncbi:MAG: DUF881 domain-containing protein [Methanoregulaceae archaeon]|nr:DUF881 domain-containing protein [Methanoregulaceae archaeon]